MAQLVKTLSTMPIELGSSPSLNGKRRKLTPGSFSLTSTHIMACVHVLVREQTHLMDTILFKSGEC